MRNVFLFDWGDTLMIDFPDQKGKMCDWPIVEAVNGAFETLEQLSQLHDIYVATNAADSSELDIKRAFERVGLSGYIHGYFCKANLGVGKGTSEFYRRIMASLGVGTESITMVGDCYEKDILPAQEAGINVIWYTPDTKQQALHEGVMCIRKLQELLQ